MRRQASEAEEAPQNGILPYAAAGCTVCAWALAFPLISVALRDIDPLPLASARFAVASVLAACWLAARSTGLPSPRDMATFGGLGLIGVALYHVSLNAGQETVSPAAASFIINTLPVLTAIVAWVVLGERLSTRAWLGMAISFVGILGIAFAQPGGIALGGGASLVFLAACCSAIYFVFQRDVVRRYGALTTTAYALCAGATLLCPWLPKAVGQVASSSDDQTLIVILLFLGTFSSAIGYATWAYASSRLGVAKTANLLYLVPIATILSTVLILGQLPSAGTVLGGVLVLAGVAVTNTRWAKPFGTRR